MQSEYLIPREQGYEAILAVEQLRDHVTPHLFISELRTIEADELWMSTAYQRPSMAIHFTWKPEWPAVKNVLPMIEEKLAPFDARPHWGKLFTMAPSRIKPLYPEMSRYQGFWRTTIPTENSAIASWRPIFTGFRSVGMPKSELKPRIALGP